MHFASDPAEDRALMPVLMTRTTKLTRSDMVVYFWHTDDCHECCINSTAVKKMTRAVGRIADKRSAHVYIYNLNQWEKSSRRVERKC